jgi:hypothetical protein
MTTMMIMMTAKRMTMMMTNMAGVIRPVTKMRMMETMTKMKMMLTRREDMDSVVDMAAGNRAVHEGDSELWAETVVVIDMVPGAEAAAGDRGAAAGDLLPWTLNNSVKFLPWADVLLMAEEEVATEVAVIVEEEAAAMVAVAPVEDAEVPAGATAEVPPGDVPRAAAGADLRQWILSSAGKSLPWVDAHHMGADEAAMAAVEIAEAEAATDAAEVPVAAVPAVAVPWADHVR